MPSALTICRGYSPHAKQKLFHSSGARFKTFVGGVRSGKTRGAAAEFGKRIYIDRQYKSGRLHYWAVAPSYGIGKVQTDEVLNHVFCGKQDPLVESYRQDVKELWLKGDIVIEFKSADRPQDLVARGLDGLWMDETARMKAEAWLGNLRQRLSDRGGWALCSTTPLGKDWFYNEIWLRGDPTSEKYHPDYFNVHVLTSENTAVPLLQREVAIAKKTLPKKYFEREYMASFEVFYGKIFDMFDDTLHIVEW